METPDMRVADLADRQHRVVEYQQLRELGLGEGAIQYRADAGRLHRIHDGVYAVGHRKLARAGHLIAAVFACGKGAVVSHITAAVLWNLISRSTAAIHVTVPRSKKPRIDGVTVHLTRRLPDCDRDEVDGIPVTSVARTLLDIASVLPRPQLVRAIEQAERLRLFDMRAMEELLRRSRGKRGTKALRAALAEAASEPPDTRSPLEDRFRDFCRERGIEQPAFNVMIAGYCVDAAWPSKRVVVELDSRRHHTGTDAFEGDRKRDTKLQVAGFQIARVTDWRLKHEPDDLYEDLSGLLDLR